MCHGASLLPLNQIASQLKALRDEQGMRLNQNSQSEMRACLQKIISSLQKMVGNTINKLTEESKDNQEALKNAQKQMASDASALGPQAAAYKEAVSALQNPAKKALPNAASAASTAEDISFPISIPRPIPMRKTF